MKSWSQSGLSVNFVIDLVFCPPPGFNLWLVRPVVLLYRTCVRHATLCLMLWAHFASQRHQCETSVTYRMLPVSSTGSLCSEIRLKFAEKMLVFTEGWIFVRCSPLYVRCKMRWPCNDELFNNFLTLLLPQKKILAYTQSFVLFSSISMSVIPCSAMHAHQPDSS